MGAEVGCLEADPLGIGLDDLADALIGEALRVRRVACVAKAFPPIMKSSDLSPGHRAIPSILAKPIEL
jgi:hypothetical protein